MFLEYSRGFPLFCVRDCGQANLIKQPSSDLVLFLSKVHSPERFMISPVQTYFPLWPDA